MDKLFITSLILSAMPISELRGGMPVAIAYALKNNIPLYLVFISVVIMNIFGMFIAFFILDYLNKLLIKIPVYKRLFDSTIRRFRKKVDKVEEKYSSWGFIALTIFVAIPLPGTGAWTASLITWLLEIDRKKSIASISLGVLIAGIIVFLGSLGIFNIFKI